MGSGASLPICLPVPEDCHQGPQRPCPPSPCAQLVVLALANIWQELAASREGRQAGGVDLTYPWARSPAAGIRDLCPPLPAGRGSPPHPLTASAAQSPRPSLPKSLLGHASLPLSLSHAAVAPLVVPNTHSKSSPFLPTICTHPCLPGAAGAPPLDLLSLQTAH